MFLRFFASRVSAPEAEQTTSWHTIFAYGPSVERLQNLEKGYGLPLCSSRLPLRGRGSPRREKGPLVDHRSLALFLLRRSLVHVEASFRVIKEKTEGGEYTSNIFANHGPSDPPPAPGLPPTADPPTPTRQSASTSSSAPTRRTRPRPPRPRSKSTPVAALRPMCPPVCSYRNLTPHFVFRMLCHSPHHSVVHKIFPHFLVRLALWKSKPLNLIGNLGARLLGAQRGRASGIGAAGYRTEVTTGKAT